MNNIIQLATLHHPIWGITGMHTPPNAIVPSDTVRHFYLQFNGGDQVMARVDRRITFFRRTAEGRELTPAAYTEPCARIDEWEWLLPGVDDAAERYGPGYQFRRDGNTLLVLRRGVLMWAHFAPATDRLDLRPVPLLFDTPAGEILGYFSPTGNSLCPYPFVECADCYLLVLGDAVVLKRDYEGADPYTHYYSRLDAGTGVAEPGVRR